MAKAVGTYNIKIELGGESVMDSPRARKEKAIETVNRALVKSCTCGPSDACHVCMELGCTDWQDEPTQPNGRPDGSEISLAEQLAIREQLNLTAKRLTAQNILSSAITRAEAMLPHGIEVTSERAASMDAFHVFVKCPHCGTSASALLSSRYVQEHEDVAEYLLDVAHRRMRPCIEATCCDPLDRWVDGSRAGECLDFYQRCQQADQGAYASVMLTPLQLSAARSAWSAALKRKQAEQREKERTEIVCDDDRWEP